jgi:hypothetical protein
MQMIRQMIKESQYRHKSYANAHHIDCNYEVGDKFFFQVKSHKSSLKFGKGDKLSPRFWDLSKLWKGRDQWPIDYPCLIL